MNLIKRRVRNKQSNYIDNRFFYNRSALVDADFVLLPITVASAIKVDLLMRILG